MAYTSRSKINHGSLQKLMLDFPALNLIRKDSWQDYLVILAAIYTDIDERGNDLSAAHLQSIIQEHYPALTRLELQNRVWQLKNLFIEELAVLREYKTRDTLMYGSTPNGKDLLLIFEGKLAGKKGYPASRAESIVSALHAICLREEELSVEGAIRLHQQEIAKRERDIEVLRKHGLRASAYFSSPISVDEHFQRAKDNAVALLADLAHVEKALDDKRIEILRRFRASQNAGQEIRTTVAFFQELAETPEYQSLNKAGLFLSVNGPTETPYGNFTEMLERIHRLGLIDAPTLRSSPLWGFQEKVQRSIHRIHNAYGRQVRLLRQRIEHALREDTNIVLGALETLFSALDQNPDKVQNLLNDAKLPTVMYEGVVAPPMVPSQFRPRVFGKRERVSMSEPSAEARRDALQVLGKINGISIDLIIERAIGLIQKAGCLSLSRYPFAHGVFEYYVVFDLPVLFEGSHPYAGRLRRYTTPGPVEFAVDEERVILSETDVIYEIS